MARANTPTLLSLDQYADLMGLSPWEINGFGAGLPYNFNLQSPHVWMQYDYQVDFMSREELASNIARAEEMLAEELGYFPGPKYTVGEEVQYPRNFLPTAWGYGGDVRGNYKTVKSKYMRVIAGGIRTFTLLGTTAVTLSDSDNDGILDTFTASFATTITDASQLSITFAAADRFGGQSVDDTWLIRPLQITISGGTATIKGRAAQLAKPIIQAGATVDPGGLDVTDTSNYVTTIEVYKDVIDSTVVAGAGNTANQGQAEWDGDWTVPPASVQYLPVALMDISGLMGVLGVDWLLNGNQCPPQPREPDRVVINYLSGVPYQTGFTGKIPLPYADLIAKLATGLFAVGRAGANRSARIIDWWRQTPNHGDVDRPLTAAEIDGCPFGASRGGLWAWKRVQNLRQLPGMSLL